MHERRTIRKTLSCRPERVGGEACGGFPWVRGLQPGADGPADCGLFSLENKKN